MQCEVSRNTVINGITSNITRQMEYSNMFDYQDELFTIKSELSDYQKVVDDINQSFGEELIMKMGSQPIFGVVQPSESLINRYLHSKDFEKQVSTAPTEFLSPKQQAEFDKLQRIGLISPNSNTVGGKTYYKIPGNNDDNYNRLLDYIKNKKLDFIHVINSMEGNYIQIGEIERAPEDVTSTISSQASGITKARVLRFLSNIGFRNVQEVNQLEYQGKPIPGYAYVDMINGVMKIVEGKEDYTLPEEAMHILTTLIKQSRPPLFSQMKAEIVNYKLYRDVVNDPVYSTSPLYRTEDGDLDYDKLKEEAIAKVMAEYLINQLQESHESERRLERAMNWWQQIIQWIREKFGAYKNPFQQALAAINEDDTTFGEFVDISEGDIFLAAKSVEQIDRETPQNRDLWQSIKDKATNLNIYKVDSDYYRNDEKVPEEKRVSNLVAIYRKRLFGNRNFDDALKEFYEQSRLDGSYIHEIFEEVINSNIDPVTGLMRRTAAPIDFPLEGNPLQGKIVKDAQAYLKRFMALYPEGTRFLTEQVIYDEVTDRYGTIDFLAILPDGKVDVIDWKSVLLQDLEGVKDYKKGEIFIQLNEYARILKEQYAIPELGKLRAIPIKKHYKKDKDTQVSKLVSIEIGSADPSKITQEQRYLRPIISPEETTGSDVRDEIITKLEALYQKYIDKGYFQTDRSILNDVQEAIYEIRINNSVENLSRYFTDLTTKFRQFLPEAEKLKEGNKDDISEALSLISFYQDIITNVVNPAFYLTEDVTIAQASRAKLQTASSQLTYLSRKFDSLRQELLDSLAKRDGVFNLLQPEKVVGLARRYFRSMGSQDIASVRYMYELVKKSYGRIDIATDRDLKSLQNLKYEFDEWRKKNNLTVKEATARLVDFEKGRIHSKISDEFYKKREQLVQDRNGKEIIKFITENYNIEEYKNWYNTTLAENKRIWEASKYDPDDETKNKVIIRAKIKNFETTYNIFTNPVTAYGFHNPKVWGRNIKEELWYSEKYKELLKPGNEALLGMYNFMVNKNKGLSEIGAIKDYQQYTFLPNVRKTFADIMSFEDTSTLEKIRDLAVQQYTNWRSKLSVNDYELNFQGARDPFTGEKLEKRFIPFVSNFDNGEKSFDIFAIYGLMSKEIHKETYLQENDEILRSLLHYEKMKPNLLQNKFGKVATSASGKLEISKEVGKNAPILEEHVKAVVNGERLQYDADFVVTPKLREKWNKSPLGKLYQFDTNPETYKPTAISMTKFLLMLNNVNQRRVLGLNAASAISNLFGGTYASNRLYKRYIGDDLSVMTAAWQEMTSGGFYQSEEMKKKAALVDYFVPLLQNREAFKASQLSVNRAARILSQEWLMAPMRKTSEIVQMNIILAFMANTGIVEGKIVNLREKAAQELNYFNRYELAPLQRQTLQTEFEVLLKKYKDQYGIAKAATFKKVKIAGKDETVVELPGIARDSDEVRQIRDLIQTMSKDALGEADEFDLANYKYSIWWRLFMTFKNWIPRQADVRFGEFRYDQAHQSHEYGRFRMFAKALSANYVHTILKVLPIPFVAGKIWNKTLSKETLIQRAKDVYAEKLLQAKRENKYNADTFISQGEFVDKFLQGVDSTFAEMRTIILMNLIFFLGIVAPDDDDDSEDKAVKALIRRQIDKLSDEVGFFYSPKNGIDIAGGGIPMLSFVRDTWFLGTNVTEQFFGFSFEQLGWDEKGIKMQEQAKPIKRAFKVFPVLKEILNYLPAVDEETAKGWGVRVSDRRGF